MSTTDALDDDSALEDETIEELEESNAADELIARLETRLEEETAETVLELIAEDEDKDEETTRGDEDVAGAGVSSPLLPPQETNRAIINIEESKVTALRRGFIINKFIMVAITIKLEKWIIIKIKNVQSL